MKLATTEIRPDLDEITRIQDRAIREAQAAMRPGASVLTIAPTGAGKTRINSRNIQDFAKAFEAEHGRPPVVLALQHRENLVDQASKAFGRWAPESTLTTAMSKGGELVHGADVNFALVQTVAARAEHLYNVDLLTIDEAHHASDAEGADYTHVIDQVRSKNPDAVIAATTATPVRPDARGLNDEIKDAKQVAISYAELERAGQIVLPTTKDVTIEIDDDRTLTDVARKFYKPDKDANQAGLTKALQQAKPATYNEQMLDAWERHFADPLKDLGLEAGTLVYDSNIRSARAFAKDAADRGVRVGFMDSDSDPEQNRRVLADYASGALEMVVSVKMLDEGTDVPRTRAIMINRETTSAIEYSQMVGRSMRTGDDPALQGIRPVVFDGGASTMIHGSVERRAAIMDYFHRLERGEVEVVRNDPPKHVPSVEGERYSPWKTLKDPPPVLATTDGKRKIFAVAGRSADGSTVYSLAESVEDKKGMAKTVVMRDATGKPMIAISGDRLRQLEAETLLPNRHTVMRLEVSSSDRIKGASLLEERLKERPEFADSAIRFAQAMSGAGQGR